MLFLPPNQQRQSTEGKTVHLQLSINISCLHGSQQQTCWLLLLLSINGTDRRTDA